MSKKRNNDNRPDDEAIHVPVTDGAEESAADPQGDQADAADPAGADDQLEAVKAERDELFARLQRALADYANYQRRTQREHEEALQRTTGEVIRAMLDVIDDLERAIEHAKANHSPDDPLLVGTELVRDKALAAFKRFGVEPVIARGATFDPSLHEALMQQPSDEAAPMTVLNEIQKGYTINGRPLRPAKVVVATEPVSADNAPPAPQEGEGDADV